MLSDVPRAPLPPFQVQLPTLTAERLAQVPDAVVIDLRSPGEYAQDHVPGAHNVPLFDDQERALIGTLYRQTAPEAAFEQGRRIVQAHVRELVEKIARLAAWDVPAADLARRVELLTGGGLEGLTRALVSTPAAALPERAVVLHCWRGGLRSRSVVALLRWLGLERALVLEGGYRGFRALVLRTLEDFEAPASYALRGLTGVGKTLVLRELELLRPRWTLDLEQLAQHRSSILGMVGLAPVSQRAFESRLCARLAHGFDGPLVVEGESRKVGDVILPRRVWGALRAATNLELVAPVERRVEVLIEDYLARPESRAELLPQLAFIDERLGLAGDERLAVLLERGQEQRVVRTLLERYYDPRYRHGEQGQHYAARFDASDPRRCAAEIAAWIEARA